MACLLCTQHREAMALSHCIYHAKLLQLCHVELCPGALKQPMLCWVNVTMRCLFFALNMAVTYRATWGTCCHMLFVCSQHVVSRCMTACVIVCAMTSYPARHVYLSLEMTTTVFAYMSLCLHTSACVKKALLPACARNLQHLICI